MYARIFKVHIRAGIIFDLLVRLYTICLDKQLLTWTEAMRAKLFFGMRANIEKSLLKI